MLIDRVKTTFKSGNGGDGVIKFWSNGKPCGGNGGNGGNIYLEGTKNLRDLKPVLDEKSYRAEDGTHGGFNQISGKNGDDFTLKVPITTTVFDQDNNEILSINQDGQRLLLLKGGRGGLGNHVFRAGQETTLRKRTQGAKGQTLQVTLELRLYADVVFIGFPNAGKSSMLNALTNATVEVAPYPFTTKQPNLGVAESLILMDLPGLIEGTSQGKGLGTKFVKHTKYARLMIHFLNLESDDLIQDYLTMRREIEAIDTHLSNLKEIIFLNKKDLVDDKYIKMQISNLSKYNSNILATSSFEHAHYKNIIEYIQKNTTNP